MTPDTDDALRAENANLRRVLAYAVGRFTDPDIVTKDPAARILRDEAAKLGIRWPWADQFPDLAPKEVTPCP